MAAGAGCPASWPIGTFGTMKLPRVMLPALAALGAALLLAGCPLPDGSSDITFTPIELGTNYGGEAIASGGTRYYRFTTAAAGSYGVLLANIAAGGNLAFAVYDTADLAGATPLLAVDGSPVNGNESDQVDLDASRTCYVVVTEKADPGADVSFWILAEYYD
jgi:hypothetical protein